MIHEIPADPKYVEYNDKKDTHRHEFGQINRINHPFPFDLSTYYLFSA